MSFTSEDRLKDAVLPLVRAIRPAREIRRQRALERAVSDDGYIKSRAILPATNAAFGGGAASNTLPSSDTVNYLAYLQTMVPLSAGTWSLYVWGALTGTLSGSSNFNSRMVVNGEASANYQIPLTSTQIGTTFPELLLLNVPGGSEVEIELQFRPSAGTATVEAGHFKYRAERIA